MSEHISEVVNAEIIEAKSADQEKKPRIPNPVMLHTKGGDTIILAPRVNGYDKYYFAPGVRNFDSATPKRVKKIKFPVNREKTIFNNCWELFTHLTKECGYKRYKIDI